jgi:hypothetical protein
MKYVKGRKPSGSMLVAVVALVVALTGGAYAASKINGKHLVRNSVASSKIKNKTLKNKDFSNQAKRSLEGDRGPRGRRGPRGPQGPQGDTGVQGPAGQVLVADEITPPSSEFPGTSVVDVPALSVNSGGPAADGGTQLVDPVDLDEGTYKIEGTVQFFDFEGGAAAGAEYGVAKVFVNGVNRGTLWSGDVPDDGNNAAQANGSMIVDVPSGGATLSIRAAVRTAESDGGQAGGNLIVTAIG